MLKTLKSKLILAFSVIFLLLAAVFAAGYIGLNNMNTSSEIFISQIQIVIPQSAQDTTTALIEDIHQSKSSAQLWMIVMVSVAGVFSLGICIFASISLTKGLKIVRLALDKMAKGDLTQTLTLQTADESGKMAGAYREMQKYLIDLMFQLKADAGQLSSAGEQLSISAFQSSEATKQVAVSSQQMAKGAQEQSNNAQETAKQVEDLVTTISQVSNDASNQMTEIKSAM